MIRNRFSPTSIFIYYKHTHPSFLGMCVWEPVYGVDGPHPYGQWGVYMPNEYVAEVVSWMSANHGEFEVLFHPNTGYMVGGKIHLSFLFDAQVYDREMLRRRHLVQHLEFDVNSQIKIFSLTQITALAPSGSSRWFPWT